MFLKFIIEKNADFVDQLSLSEFIDEQNLKLEELQNDNATDEEYSSDYCEKINFLADACNNEFSFAEVVVLFNEMRGKLPYSMIKDQVKCYDYLMDKYREMKMRDEKTKIQHRFSYLRSIIGKDYST